MKSIETAINDIQTLIRCGDLSDTPQLRELYADFMRALKELNNSLAQCQTLINNGSPQEARKLNSSFEPSLTHQAEMLDFPQHELFFSICREYGLAAPEFPDKKLVDFLCSPVSCGEKHLHTLLQEYRKIARNGNLKERISLLRKIIAKLPDSTRWQKDLVSAERGRFQEIRQRMENLIQQENNQKELEELYRELLDPEWNTTPPPELLSQIRELLQNLQKENLKQEAEKRLRQLQERCIEQNTAELREEFNQWLYFCTNPMLQLTQEQKREAADIENFLIAKEEELQKAEELNNLIRQIGEKLADNCSYSEVAGDHKQLLLIADDQPLPPALIGQLNVLAEEASRNDRLRNIRRAAFCVLLVAAAIAGVLGLFRYRQHRQAVRTICGDLQKQMDEEKYDELLAFIGSLEKNSPAIARDQQVRSFARMAVQKRQDAADLLKQQQSDFAGLLKQLKRLSDAEDVWDNADITDRTITACKELLPFQTDEQKEKFRELETRIAQKRTERKQKTEQGFLDYCRSLAKQMQDCIDNIEKQNLEDLSLFQARVPQKFTEKARITPGLSAELKNRELQSLEKLRQVLAKVIEDESFRRSLKVPADFLAYAAGLDASRGRKSALAAEYTQAVSMLEEWRDVFDSYQHGSVPISSEQLTPAELDNCRGILKKDLLRLMPSNKRSKEFSQFFSELRNLGPLKEIHFTSSKGDFFFYTTKELIWEKLTKPKRINISFYSIEKGQFFSFRYEYANAAEPLKPLKSPRKLTYKFPERLALPAGIVPEADQVARPWAGTVMTDKFAALASDGPGIQNNLQAALLWLLAEGNVNNIYLKELLIVRFLSEFSHIWPLSTEAADAVQKLQNYQLNRDRNWRAPQEVKNYEEEKKYLKTLWDSIDLPKCFAAAKLRIDFICAFHARRLTPIGIVQEAYGNRVKIHSFSKTKPAEMLVLNKGKFVMLSKEVWNNKPKEKDLPYLFTGQVLWGFEDNRPTQEFVREWEKKATQQNFRLNIRPLICPEGIVL